jgi:hypothetical protein
LVGVAASTFTPVARADGSVVAWGANDEGQLGNGAPGANVPLGTSPKRSATPVRVTGLADIIDIAAGRKHAGSLRVVSALAPVAVPGLEGITQIAVGPRHNLSKNLNVPTLLVLR